MRVLVKYLSLLSLIIVIVTLPEVGMCQTAIDVETAVLPLPANLQSDASVMTYTAEGTLRIARIPVRTASSRTVFRSEAKEVS